MSKSNIEWTQETWNPVVGCSILSPGCTNCYAMGMAARIEAMNAEAREIEHTTGKYKPSAFQYDGTTKKVNGHAVWTGKVVRAPENVRLAPLKRKKPTMYFVNSMSDLFHEDIPDEWIDQVFAVMALTPHHTYQVLTKRAERMRQWFGGDRADSVGLTMLTIVDRIPYGHRRVPWPLDNVWLGVSTERQKEADERIPLLLQTPAAVRFISLEPLLGPIDLTSIRHGTALANCLVVGNLIAPDRIDWVITGGESGPNARPSHPQWFRDIRDACGPDGVAFFFKQWGNWRPDEPDGSAGRGDMVAWPDGTVGPGKMEDHGGAGIHMFNVGKKRAGRLLDGRTHDEMPSPPDHVITPARRAAAAE